MANRALATAAMCALVAVLLPACANGASDAAASGEPSSGGSASDASIRPAPPTGGTPTPTSTPSGECVASSPQVTVQPGESPQPICLRVGAVLRIHAPASPRQPWQPFLTSDPQVASCTTTQGPDGAATATCRALRAGSTIIRSMTAPFAGDPHGPMQQEWQLTVNVRD
jgi:hypothetical protein